MKLKEGQKTLLYLGSIIFIITVWWLFYAPVNYCDYNSDHAMHVLMSRDFQLPRDSFYWGQNRLGSLFPFVAFLLSKVMHIHLLYVCSFTQFLFLGASFVVMGSFITHRSLKVALCALLFLPVNEYNALILIGHPYSSQLFAGALFLLCLYRLKKHILKPAPFDSKSFLIGLLWSFLAAVFYYAGVWVSEFNMILILVPGFFVCFDTALRSKILSSFKNAWFLLFGALSIAFLAATLLIFKEVKATATADSVYDKIFIDNAEDLQKNAGYFFERLGNSLLFRDNAPFENFFNWFLIIVTLVLIARRFLKKEQPVIENRLPGALFLVSFVSCIFLLFSVWNFRSLFSPRYFTPVYVMFCYALIINVDRKMLKKWQTVTISALFVFFGLSYCYAHAINVENRQDPFEKFGEYRKLPKGTIIGDYWDVYRICSVAMDSLQPLPYDHLCVRNWDQKEKLLAETNFYFLKNGNDPKGGIHKKILEFGIFFEYSGTSYICNGTEVLLYHKVPAQQSRKFAIKSFNNLYFTVDKDFRIRANEPDPAKAEVFEIILFKGDDKKGLKASNGKYVSANEGQSGQMYASSADAWGWERFEIYMKDDTHMNIYTASQKFACAEKSDDNFVIANRERAGEWEEFVFEPR